jgi:hypothetical protein
MRVSRLAISRATSSRFIKLPEPLGVPRNVVVDQEVAELQVDAFACRLGSNQHLDVAIPRFGCWSLTIWFLNPIAREEAAVAKLKLGVIADDKPVRLTVELSAVLHRDLVAYGQALARETGQGAVEPAKLIGPMLARFMATARAFAKLQRRTSTSEKPS